jgi:murein DD-endopeptidase MepM/ murein hydrolase activator NlpD
VDIGCRTGTPVYAPAPGIVEAYYNDGSFGKAECLRHADGWYTLYAHLSRLDVLPGQVVARGQMLGLSGATGYVTAAHLHWQLCDSPNFPTDIGRSRDPLAYLITEEQMENYRWALVRVATGPFRPMLDAYTRLDAAGYFTEIYTIENRADPIDGVNDLNDSVVRRLRIQWLAGGPRALEAAKLLGVG